MQYRGGQKPTSGSRGQRSPYSVFYDAPRGVRDGQRGGDLRFKSRQASQTIDGTCEARVQPSVLLRGKRVVAPG